MISTTKARRPRGISLIDLLVAFTVFSVAIMCVLTIFPTSMRTLRKARIASMASHLAESALEDMVYQGATNFAGIPASTVTTTTLQTLINGTMESIDFTTTVTTSTVSTSLKDVVVTVTWYESLSDKANNSNQKSYKMETMVADRPTSTPSASP